MDITKLKVAASLVKNTNPRISQELIKIAQELNNMGAPQTATEMAAPDMPAEQPADFKNYALPEDKTQKRTHKITFSVEVPQNWGELEIMNELLPKLKEIQEKEPSISIKGYQFAQS